MKQITSISEKFFLGSYMKQNWQRQVFDPFFFGVVLTLIVPQLIFFLYYGRFFALVFGVCALGGGVLGVRAYRRSSSPFTELRLGTVSRTSARDKTISKKAA